MPLWHIYHPPTVFADQATKAALARDITAIYTSRGMPPFYVNVFFHPLAGENVFIGAVPQSNPTGSSSSSTLEKPFVRLVGEHIAVIMGDDTERMNGFCERFTAAVKPYIEDKGYMWEYHIDETPTAFWRIQGLRPPPFGSEAMKMWARDNKAVAWEGEYDAVTGAKKV